MRSAGHLMSRASKTLFSAAEKKVEKIVKKLLDNFLVECYYIKADRESGGHDVPCKLNNEKAKDEPENS